MDMKEKLVELISNSQYLIPAWECTYDEAAKDLLDSGVIVLPCKVGERVFCVLHSKYKIVEDIVEDYDIWSIKNGIKLRISLLNYNNYVIGEFGKTVFLTREEAEAKLKEGEKND